MDRYQPEQVFSCKFDEVCHLSLILQNFRVALYYYEQLGEMLGKLAVGNFFQQPSMDFLTSHTSFAVNFNPVIYRTVTEKYLKGKPESKVLSSVLLHASTQEKTGSCVLHEACGGESRTPSHFPLCAPLACLEVPVYLHGSLPAIYLDDIIQHNKNTEIACGRQTNAWIQVVAVLGHFVRRRFVERHLSCDTSSATLCPATLRPVDILSGYTSSRGHFVR